MGTQLNSNGNAVIVGLVTLRTPGLQGEANVYLPVAHATAMRSAEKSTRALEEALARQNVEPQLTVEILNPREVPMPGVSVRATTFGEPAIVVDVPAPGDKFGQFVLFNDESGVMSWHYPLDPKNRIDLTRGPGKRTYVIPRTVRPHSANGTRGLLGALGKKLLKVLVFPLVDPILGAVGDFFVKRWEEHYRSYMVRTFTPDNYKLPSTPIGSSDWSMLASGRALLMVHGTFSLAHLAFGGFPREYVDLLHEKYKGRVFGFDHYTLGQDPDQNVEWLLQQIPKGINLDVDIISHSRGGLVARTLAHPRPRPGSTAVSVSVNRLVFAGAPNNGTPLTDTGYMGRLLDSYTSLLNLFPDTGPLEILDAIIAVVRQLSVDTVLGLDGLQAMRPGGPFLSDLDERDSGGPGYFALASEYHPPNPGPGQYLEVQLMNTVFHASNDLVVPTTSVYSLDKSDLVPSTNRYVFGAAEEVQHGAYFLKSIARDKIATWLQ
jgi:hypothetical protein